ncbi:MAG: hypothetical protein R2909_22590 [Gemmatimonadales bacterium]
MAAPLVIAVAGYTAYQRLAGEPLPSSVVGTWSTSDGRYASRSFTSSNPTAVAGLQNRTSTNDFSVHPIKKITTKLATDTLKLTIDYEIEGKGQHTEPGVPGRRPRCGWEPAADPLAPVRATRRSISQ